MWSQAKPRATPLMIFKRVGQSSPGCPGARLPEKTHIKAKTKVLVLAYIYGKVMHDKTYTFQNSHFKLVHKTQCKIVDLVRLNTSSISIKLMGPGKKWVIKLFLLYYVFKT